MSNSINELSELFNSINSNYEILKPINPIEVFVNLPIMAKV